MSAVLKFARVPKPVTRPVYRRSDLLSFPQDWIKANRDLLVEWYGDSPQDGFEYFAISQWEIACNQHDEHKQTYRGP